MLFDSSICHLRDTANLLTGTRTTEKPERRRRPKRQGCIHPSSPLYRVFVDWSDGGREHAVLAGAWWCRLVMQPARGDVARRDGEARRGLFLADVHRVRAPRVKTAAARRGEQAW